MGIHLSGKEETMFYMYLNNEYFAYNAFHMMKAFFPNTNIKCMVREEQEAPIIIERPGEKEHLFEMPAVQQGDRDKAVWKHAVDMELYRFLAAYTNKTQEWGMLMGIRPTKILMKELDHGKSEAEAAASLQEKYLVSPEKAQLGASIAVREKALLDQLDYRSGYSLYVGIPFCPTRCSYCSFTSYPISKWKSRVDAYLDALLLELTAIGRMCRTKKLDTLYIGGGTPTTLTEGQLDRLLSHIENTFSLEQLKEYTVEAGRPDSITRDKLLVLHTHGIGRISINPQTMQQKTLDLIGRQHTVASVRQVYNLARTLGFDNINMDLIMGLPGETLADAEDTLQQIEKLAPDSLTVHSLAIKRASLLNQKQCESIHKETPGQEAVRMSEMIRLAADYAKRMELAPYYLYRQKNMAGNFENVGYAKVQQNSMKGRDDQAGIYNVLIMEEKQSILAAGAGASTKIVLPRETDNIKRVENVKDIDLYITRIQEMIQRKEEWI